MTGGEINYSFVRELSDGRQIYEINVIIYRDALSGGSYFDDPLYLTVYNMDNPGSPKNKFLFFNNFEVSDVPLNELGPCALNVPNVRIEKGVYRTTDTVFVNDRGYVYVHQRCCRSDVINNLYFPGEQGSTYSVHLTREAMLAKNSNPDFNQEAPILVCIHSNFEYRFTASDVDGHRLEYTLCEPFAGGNSYTDDGIRPETAARPPYNSVRYENGYSYDRPFSREVEVSLNPNTGLFAFSPNKLGKYTVAVCVEEFDEDDNSLGFIKRDMMFNVADCLVASAEFTAEGNEVEESIFAACKSLTVRFYSGSAGAKSYYWDFGDGGPGQAVSSDKDPEYQFSSPGEYNVMLVINKDEACSDTATAKVRVLPVLTPEFDYSINCRSEEVVFNGQAVSTTDPIVKRSWTVRNNQTSEQNSFVYQYDKGGIYSVRYTVETQKGCKDYIEKEISLPQFTPANFVLNGKETSTSVNDIMPLCVQNKEVVIQARVPDDVPRYWEIEGKVINELHPIYVFKNTGQQTIKLTVSPGTSCEDTKEVKVNILPQLQADFEHTLACERSEVKFKDLSHTPLNNIIGRTWRVGDNLPKHGDEFQYFFNNPGTYPVLLVTETADGCTDSIQKMITVNPLPRVQFDKFEICPGVKTELRYEVIGDDSGVVKAFWDIEPGYTSTELHPSVQYDIPGEYEYKFIFQSEIGCRDSLEGIMIVRDYMDPVITLQQDLLCEGISFIADGVQSKGIFQTYFWETDEGFISNQKEVSLKFEDGGSHIITLTLEDELCGTVQREQELTIRRSPKISIGEDFALCPGLTQEIKLISDMPLDSIYWNTGEKNVSQIAVSGNSGVIQVIGYGNMCYREASIEVIPSCEVLAPQIFTPNGDGANDYFNLIPQNVATFELAVFNRWGNEVFRTNDFALSWDGTYKGEDLPMDNYIYYATGKKTNGTDFLIKGVVLLTR